QLMKMNNKNCVKSMRKKHVQTGNAERLNDIKSKECFVFREGAEYGIFYRFTYYLIGNKK
ncbi:MAG: hypothetical protein IJB99_10945, partial [Clostridia bacterium]|nr:hypothetical protein [Clostridia bacterium]